MSGQLHAPAALSPGKEPPQDRSGRCAEEKISCPAVRPVVRRYTDRAIPALRISAGTPTTVTEISSSFSLQENATIVPLRSCQIRSLAHPVRLITHYHPVVPCYRPKA
jgi:hypothetical protein